MTPQVMKCPCCKNIFDVDISWAVKNELIFCPHCCKSFPVKVGENTEDKELEQKWDEGIKKIFEDEEKPNFDWDEF